MDKNIIYMRRALELAEKGKGATSPNPMVGCVIVKAGKIIAEGFHKKCGSDHAEIVALKKAKTRAKGATMYVTLEPCAHYGQTPPCVDAIIESGISEVVIAMKDPNPLTNGKSVRKLKKAGIKVSEGLCAVQARQMNEVFIKYITTGLPFAVAKIAQTLDGKTATAQRQSKWITSDETRRISRKTRAEFDAILVGINTVMADDPLLVAEGASRRIKKIIVDSRLRISHQARILTETPPQDVILAATSRAKSTVVTMFAHRGYQIIICRAKNGRVDLKDLFRQLAEQKITSVLIEGGAQVIGSALREQLVDKMQIYIAPKVFGDQKALSSVVGINASRIAEAVELERLTLTQFKKDVRIEGYVLRNR